MFFNKLEIFLVGLSTILNFSSAPVEEIEIIEYETEYVYAEKYSEGEELIIKNGEYGYSHIIDGEIVETKEPVNQILQVGTHKNADYVGTLTGYGPECKGCSKKGIVACSTSDKKSWSLVEDGIIYNDLDYGEVNIIASDTSLFPCGTIIAINNSKYENVLAVVLDTGYTMRKAWRTNGVVHLDLAFNSEKETKNVTDKKTSYHVKRWGW